VLNNIVDLVKFTKDKDVFKEFYITQLAKRLLLGRSASTEEEINMVKKLQTGA
jgi:cullin-4